MTESSIAVLRQASTIRQRSHQLFQMVANGDSPYFELQLDNIQPCLDFILELTKKRYPDGHVPFHSRLRHFEMDGINRIKSFFANGQGPESNKEQARSLYEIIILSVLLDAGAGSQWRYLEPNSQKFYQRSEGLALASLYMYQDGLFSSTRLPVADLEGLATFSAERLGTGFQVSDNNPLVGLEGRAQLIQSLANVIRKQNTIFKNGRLADFYDHIIDSALISEQEISVPKVFHEVLSCFSEIWPSRIQLDGVNLGDVWQHPKVTGEGNSNQLIPFHKLSQWLTYSLLEPLKTQGYQLIELDSLTGLAEYRNGGLLIDSDIIKIKNEHLLEQPLTADHHAIIEWRALTVCLLDKLWQQACHTLNKTPCELPLVGFLEAGTWVAGRQLAKQKRANGEPPIQIISDGTVF